MTELEARKISLGWLAIALPAIGAAIFYLWQPITDFFVTGAYDENVIIQLDTESVKTDGTSELLVIHIKASNRGNVPVTIKSDGGTGQITLQVRRIEKAEDSKWLEPDKLQLVSEINALRAHKGGYIIAPNAYYEEVESIALPTGTYWVKGSINFENGEYIDQVTVVRHGK